MLLSELRIGELEIIEASSDLKRYKCGHEGASCFKLRMGHWNLVSPLITQDVQCSNCARKWTCENLHRCPLCQKVYEVVPGSNSVTLSSFRHFSECFPQNAPMVVEDVR